MSRMSIDDYYVEMLAVVAKRGTCRRRQVAAILVDSDGVFICTGYNGVPSKMPHCIDEPCDGATDAPGNNANCLAIHAESNCLLRAGDKLDRAHTLYVSTTPCFDCAKLVISARVKEVVTVSVYADTRGLNLLALAKIPVRMYVKGVQ